jgi:hypothetical protein
LQEYISFKGDVYYGGDQNNISGITNGIYYLLVTFPELSKDFITPPLFFSPPAQRSAPHYGNY